VRRKTDLEKKEGKIHGKKRVIKVNGMSCSHCKQSIENGLKEIGVDSKVNLEEKDVTVIFDPAKIQTEQIIQTIEELDYEVVKP